MTRLELAEPFAGAVRATWGAAGEDWLRQLPDLLPECAALWSLTLGRPLASTFHYVVDVTRADGTPAILKLGVPRPELAMEVAALRLHDGRGMALLLEEDLALGAQLLERVAPGTPLTALAARDDDRATAVAAEVMLRLWRPLPAEHPFPSIADWAGGLARLRRAYAGGTGPLPAALVARGETLFAELLASAGAPVLLHGDLHHDNILAATREPWLAIDPKGVAGERAAEAAALLRNPLPDLAARPDLPRVLARRLDLLAERLDGDRERLRSWGIALNVLSAAWAVEDGTDWRPALRVAETLAGD